MSTNVTLGMPLILKHLLHNTVTHKEAFKATPSPSLGINSSASASRSKATRSGGEYNECVEWCIDRLQFQSKANKQETKLADLAASRHTWRFSADKSHRLSIDGNIRKDQEQLKRLQTNKQTKGD